MIRLQVLQSKWVDKDTKEEILVEDIIQTHQKNRYKKLELIVFEFTLYKAKVKTIYI